MKAKSGSSTECAPKKHKTCTKTRLGNINPKKGLSQYFIHFFRTQKFYPSFKELNENDEELTEMESIAFPKFAKYPLSYCQLRRTLK